MDSKKYMEISHDVWVIFKRYLPEDTSLDSFTNDVHSLDQKYKDDPEAYGFMQKLLQAYFEELNRVKG